MTWRQNLEAFKAENPGVEIPEEISSPPATEAPAEAAPPAEGAAEPAVEEPKVAEGDEEPYTLAEETALTPQAFNDLIKGKPERDEFFKSDPEFKGAVMKLAREHAELAQFKGIYPNKESAEFAKQQAASKVALRTQFQNADTPEGMSKAFDSFAQEFAVIDPKTGKQAVDAAGEPVFGDDLYQFGEHMVGRYIDSTMAEVEARLQANQYKSEEDRIRDEDMKIAATIFKSDLNPESKAPQDPDLSSLAPDVRAQVQARLDEAKKIEKENAEKTGKASKQNREQVRKEGTTKFFSDSAARMWPQVDKMVEKMRAAGAVIPEWQLTAALPGSKVSAFRNAIGQKVEQFIKADPHISNQMLDLEMQYLANPTPENHNQRVEAFDRILKLRDHTGKSFLNRVVSGVIREYGATVQQGAERTTVADAPAASREPVHGGPVHPKALSPDDAYHAAEIQLAKEVQGWDNMSNSERMAQIMGRQKQLLSAKR